ncbi:MAG: inner membrane-spanning protein YciB, partial [Caulobacteraceae bacterium]
MKSLFHSLRFFVLDMASTIVFLALYAVTKNITLAVALGMVLGVAQIGFEFVRKRPIDTMQWMSLFLVLATGVASLLTQSPRFLMLKPSLIYAIVGVVMLKPGWMNRYLPEEAKEYVPDLGLAFGYVWAGLMFVSAVVNLVLAARMTFLAWGAFMSAYGLVTKLGLF